MATLARRIEKLEEQMRLRRASRVGIADNGSEAEFARASLRHFVRQSWSTVEPARRFLSNWHVDAICDHLQGVSEGKIRHLLITVPPGHGKSLIVSVQWPAWQWAREDRQPANGPDGPGARGIYTSYDADLAIRDSVRCRNLLTSPWYQHTIQPKWRFAGDQNEKNWFENDQKGFRISLSVNKRDRLPRRLGRVR